MSEPWAFLLSISIVPVGIGLALVLQHLWPEHDDYPTALQLLCRWVRERL